MFSLLLLVISCLSSDQSVPGFNQISERIKKHNLHPRRALFGISSCPSDFDEYGDTCCKKGTTLCCRMDGEGCHCRLGQILRQGDRKKPDGCGSQLTGWGGIQQATFSEPGFKEVCDKHDWCYTDCSKTHKQCDDEWFRGANEVCWNNYVHPSNPLAIFDLLFGLNTGKAQCYGKVAAAYDYMSSYEAWMTSIGNSCECEIPPARSSVQIISLPSIGNYFGAFLPGWRPLEFKLYASINTWNSYICFSQDTASGKRNFAAALIIRDGNVRWNDIKSGQWGREVGITSFPIVPLKLGLPFFVYGKLYSTHVEINVHGARTAFRFRNSLSVNFFMVTSGWSIQNLSIKDIAA